MKTLRERKIAEIDNFLESPKGSAQIKRKKLCQEKKEKERNQASKYAQSNSF
jgi:hypothetical protein